MPRPRNDIDKDGFHVPVYQPVLWWPNGREATTRTTTPVFLLAFSETPSQQMYKEIANTAPESTISSLEVMLDCAAGRRKNHLRQLLELSTKHVGLTVQKSTAVARRRMQIALDAVSDVKPIYFLCLRFDSAAEGRVLNHTTAPVETQRARRMVLGD